MSQLFTLEGAKRRDPLVDRWMADHTGKLGALAWKWFEVIRACGDDVTELLHDGNPTACVDGVAFVYVGAYKAHVTIGFFRGDELPDPAKLLEGTGRFMRHLKLSPTGAADDDAIAALIRAAYRDVRGAVT